MKILNEMTGQEMFFLLAGPCVIEGEEMALKIAEHVSELTDKWVRHDGCGGQDGAAEP